MSDKERVCPECGDHEIEEFETHRLCLNCGWQEKRYKKLPTEDVACPACKFKNVIKSDTVVRHRKLLTRNANQEFAHVYECGDCLLSGFVGKTPEEALANFKSLVINRVV